MICKAYFRRVFLAVVLSVCLSSMVRAADLGLVVQAMTLEQKIGQMILPSIRSFSPHGVPPGAEPGSPLPPVTELPPQLAQAIGRFGFCGIILFSENCVDVRQTMRLIDAVQRASAIPPLITVDQEGGRVARIGYATPGSGSMALAATGNPANARAAGSLIGRELAALGIHLNFAPVADVNSNPANPVIGVRAWSDDPHATARYAAEFAAGLRSAGVEPVYKHFPGHGDTDIDSHTGLPVVGKTLQELRACELIPFADGIARGVRVIMTAHIRFPAIEPEPLPATLSRTMISGVLRGELGFDGVVVTDAFSMGAIADNFEVAAACRLAINAGADILLMPVEMDSPQGIAAMGALIAELARMVRAGEIAPETVDKAVERILALKRDMGLAPPGSTQEFDARVANAQAIVGCAEHRALELAHARQAVTVLKNNDVLPLRLPATGRAVVFCPSAEVVATVRGEVERLQNSAALPAARVDVLRYDEDNSQETCIAETARTDAVVILTNTANAADLNGPAARRVDALMQAARVAGACVVVVGANLPCDAARFWQADAVLAAYMPNPGPNIPAAVAAVFGAFAPQGRLPVRLMQLAPSPDGVWHFTTEELLP